MNRYLLYFFLFKFFLLSPAYTQLSPGSFVKSLSDPIKETNINVIERLTNYHSSINWSAGVLVTEFNIPIIYNDINIGRQNNNLTEQLKTRILQFATGAISLIRISSIFSLENIFQRNEAFRFKILSILYDQNLENTTVRNSKLYSQMTIPLYGPNSISELLYQDIRRQEVTNYLQRESTSTQFYDTLIIDMVMFPFFKASLSPRILDSKGELLHSIETVNPSILKQQTSVHYVTSLSEALKHHAIGTRIAYILPQNVDGALSADIMLFDEDARRIFSQQRTIDQLKEGRVIIVMPNEK